MEFLISFLEGIITFISPCLLPMLPVYASWLAADDRGPEAGRSAMLPRALAFVVGFTLVFTLLGAFAGSIGGLLVQWRSGIEIATGLFVILFGLAYLDWLRLPGLRLKVLDKALERAKGIPGALLFGMVFSVGWTPCVGAFLGSALMLAASSGDSAKGVLMLLAYSIGLGIPFIAGAMLIRQLKGTFDAVKRHYGLIRALSGAFLILTGVLMATGLFGRMLAALSL